MRTAEWINLLFFSFFMGVAWLRASRRVAAIAICAAGVALVLGVEFTSGLFPPRTLSVVRDWLPGPLMLLAYWQAGQFAGKQNEELQLKLASFDRALLAAIRRYPAGERLYGWIRGYLELSYLLCYPLVPAGVGALYVAGMASQADEFWSAVLPPTYLCYGTTSFIQTLPPRLIGRPQEGGASLRKTRALNLWVLRHASIQTNTFPSAHVAASIAVSFELLHLLPVAGAVFLWVALSIGIASVAGRYHYAADAFLGAALAALSVPLAHCFR